MNDPDPMKILEEMGIDSSMIEGWIKEQEEFEQKMMEVAREYEQKTGKPFIEFAE